MNDEVIRNPWHLLWEERQEVSIIFKLLFNFCLRLSELPASLFPSHSIPPT
jgi:hypothetical protein